MTRSITIVNTSNWDEEPCTVDGILLMPGEMVTIGLGDKETDRSVSVSAVQTPRTARPFGTPGDSPFQVMPEARVAWVKTTNAMLGRHGEITVRDPTPSEDA